MKKDSKLFSHIVNRAVSGAVVVCAVLLLYATGIGCPVKALTGVSCPGCGMTRAWLCALRLDFYHAMAYHPLFWMVPVVLALVAMRGHVPQRMVDAMLVACLTAVLLVWAIRIAAPSTVNVLFSDRLHEDVVSVDAPAWITFVQTILSANMGTR